MLCSSPTTRPQPVMVWRTVCGGVGRQYDGCGLVLTAGAKGMLELRRNGHTTSEPGHFMPAPTFVRHPRR
jgi:hypothetical protein